MLLHFGTDSNYTRVRLVRNRDQPIPVDIRKPLGFHSARHIGLRLGMSSMHMGSLLFRTILQYNRLDIIIINLIVIDFDFYYLMRLTWT